MVDFPEGLTLRDVLVAERGQQSRDTMPAWVEGVRVVMNGSDGEHMFIELYGEPEEDEAA